MKPIKVSKSFAKSLSLLSLGFLFSWSALFAASEDSLFADFQKSVVKADPKRAQEAAMRNHRNPRTEQEVEQFAVALASAAVNAMDRGADLEKQFPESKHLPAVRNQLAEVL